MNRTISLAFSLFVGLGGLTAIAGCDSGGGSTVDTGPLSIVGRYAAGFGYEESITASTWGDATVISHDNRARVAVTQSPAWDAFTPSQFSKVEWTAPAADGSLFYCIAAYGKASAADALAAPAADPSAPASGGCGGFSWTHLVPAIEVSGRWATSFDFDEVVSSYAWSGATVVTYDNAARVAIVQNPADDAFNPSKFAKFVWTAPAADRSFDFCTVAFGLETAAAAEAAADDADRADLDAGCGGFGWTHVVPGLAIGGTWTGPDGDVTISSTGFGDGRVASYDNDAHTFVVGADDAFRKMAWLGPQGDTLYLCAAATTGPTAEAARAVALTVDASAPEASGCNGAPWVALTRE